MKPKGTFLYCRATAKETAGNVVNIIRSDQSCSVHALGCLECGIAVYPGYLDRHITSVHSNDATVRWVVKECGDSFGGFSELRQHVDTAHHALALKWCEECSRFVLQLLDYNKVQQHDARLHFGVIGKIVISWQAVRGN